MRNNLAIFLVVFSFQNIWAGQVKSMKVHFAFENKNTNLQMKLFELPLERGPDSGETEVTLLSTPFPKYKPIPADGFMVKKGGLKPFMMVIENTTNETKYFFATTHSVLPETASIGFRLGCLCNNHIYQVPPASRWTRIGQITLESFASGDSVHFIHKLIGISIEEIKSKGLEKNVVSAN